MDQENISALKLYAYTQPSFNEPVTTISLADATLNSASSLKSQTTSSSPGAEDKKPVKKRKSWGQELPVPKTNLPPRKRAKTEDEKEQRRIERVLRNRQAAQSSRERKRLEVEKLEGEKGNIEYQNKMLRDRVLCIEQEKYLLQQQVAKLQAALTQRKGSPEAQAPYSPASLPDLLHHRPDIKQELDEQPISLTSPQSCRASPLPPAKETQSMSAPVSDLTQHPAVSVRSGAEFIDFNAFSAFARDESSDSNSRTPSICNTAPLSDESFHHLFNDPQSPEPVTSFFEEGFVDEKHEDDSNTFSLDSMVNLSADLDVSDYITFDNHDDPSPSQFELIVS